jgi:hypothetical protein
MNETNASTRLRMSHEEYVERRKQDVVKVLTQAPDGSIGLLLTACKINSALHELKELEKSVQEKDFLFLTGVASECDELPLGDERQYWAPNSLREYDLRAQAYESQVRSDLLKVFARIADSLK